MPSANPLTPSALRLVPLLPRCGERLKQGQLVAFLGREAKPGRIQRLRRPLIETELAAGAVEAQPQYVRIGTGTRHALRPGRVVKPAAMGLRYEREHVSRLVRVVFLEPFLEERL